MITPQTEKEKIQQELLDAFASDITGNQNWKGFKFEHNNTWAGEQVIVVFLENLAALAADRVMKERKQGNYKRAMTAFEVSDKAIKITAQETASAIFADYLLPIKRMLEGHANYRVKEVLHIVYKFVNEYEAKYLSPQKKKEMGK